jgi:hypothetical protein
VSRLSKKAKDSVAILTTSARLVIWFVDPDTGDDSNAGDGPDAALKTWSEYKRRVGIGPKEPIYIPDGATMNIYNASQGEPGFGRGYLLLPPGVDPRPCEKKRRRKRRRSAA